MSAERPQGALPTPTLVPPTVVVALLAISSAAVLVRMAPSVHPVVVGFWRTAVVAVLLLPWARKVRARDARLILLASACLAAHFWAWFESLHLTTVARSTLLVCLGPIWVGLMEWKLLHHRPSRRFWLGIGLALPGIALLSGLGGDGSLAGDALAVVGGLLSSSYLVTSRAVRQRVSIGNYGALLCAGTAAWLLLIALALDASLWGFSSASWGVLLALALGPQLLGHIGFNYAVGYLSAAVVSAVILLEPVGATVLGAIVLDEVPSMASILGGLIILAGVALALSDPRRATEAALELEKESSEAPEAELEDPA